MRRSTIVVLAAALFAVFGMAMSSYTPMFQ
jgi:hypothetical protein